jgi:hypothetical protein
MGYYLLMLILVPTFLLTLLLGFEGVRGRHKTILDYNIKVYLRSDLDTLASISKYDGHIVVSEAFFLLKTHQQDFVIHQLWALKENDGNLFEADRIAVEKMIEKYKDTPKREWFAILYQLLRDYPTEQNVERLERVLLLIDGKQQS